VKDGPVRRALKRVALWNFRFGLAVTRFAKSARGERPFRLAGACQRSGCCCEAPGIQVGWAVWFVPTLRRLFLLWQERVNGFVLTERDVRHRVFVFRCTHYDRETRSCDSYDTRPGMCRDYPRLQLYQAHPNFLPGCGYRAVPANADGLLFELRRRKLSPEQIERVSRGLGLRAEDP
jgi:Fe-S-cluster containining protein